MFKSKYLLELIRNLSIYVIGTSLAVTGALGLAEAIDISTTLSALLFATGILLVIAVHEFLGGPV